LKILKTTGAIKVPIRAINEHEPTDEALSIKGLFNLRNKIIKYLNDVGTDSTALKII